MFVLSVLEAPNTKTNSLCVQTLGNKALSDSETSCYSHPKWAWYMATWFTEKWILYREVVVPHFSSQYKQNFTILK